MLSRMSAVVCAIAVAVSGGAISVVAQAHPIVDASVFVAQNIEGAGARLALSAGKFVRDQTSGVVDVVDEVGKVSEELPPQLEVDGRLRALKFEIDSTGRRMQVAVEGGLTEGAKIAGDGVRRGGYAAQACFDRGLPAAVEPALMGALTGAINGLWTLNPVGIVTSAAIGGLAGAWSGFTSGCTKGVTESLHQPTGVGRTYLLDQDEL